MEKICTVCLISKDLSCFGKCKSGRLGTRAMCKICYNIVNKDWNRIRLYGVNHLQYKDLINKCGGLCEICGNKPQKKEDLCVDHDHVTLKIRGLLCKNCNLGLGKFGDSEDSLIKVIEYLKRPLIIPEYNMPKNNSCKNKIKQSPELIYKDNKPVGRVCSGCSTAKSFDHFCKFKYGFMGFKSICKQCDAKRKFVYKLKEWYGMSLSQYETIYSQQEGRCAICCCKSQRELCIDHDHTIEPCRVRGLLCHDCNMGLGILGDSLERLEKAIKYLQKE